MCLTKLLHVASVQQVEYAVAKHIRDHAEERLASGLGVRVR